MGSVVCRVPSLCIIWMMEIQTACNFSFKLYYNVNIWNFYLKYIFSTDFFFFWLKIILKFQYFSIFLLNKIIVIKNYKK